MKLDWDPEIDTPATVAILGGGPVGIEAALYARFLGYYVILFDARRVGSRLTRWGDQLLPVTWGEATSSLGLAALEAQEMLDGLPSSDAAVSCRDYVEKYLTPVAKSDLIIESVQINSPVISISRAHWPKGQPASIETRAEDEFRILVRSQVRGEYTQLADIVLDCTGESRVAAGIGPGGGQAIGQVANNGSFEVGIRDPLDKDRDKFVGKQTVMFGADVAACRNATQFAKLVAEHAGTKLTWIVPQGIKPTEWLKPAAELSADLAIDVQRMLAGDVPGVVTIEAWGAEAVARDASGKWQLNLLVGDEETLDVTSDVVLVTETGANWGFADGLNLELCPTRSLTDSATKWLDSQPAEGELTVSLDSILTTEPHYYVLGRKSVGGLRRFSFAHARQQIRQAFALIGGRAELDLYQTVKPQKAI
jgi:hypothetical protein